MKVKLHGFYSTQLESEIVDWFKMQFKQPPLKFIAQPNKFFLRSTVPARERAERSLVSMSKGNL